MGDAMADTTAQRSFFIGEHSYYAITYVGEVNQGFGNNGLGLTPEFVFSEGLLHYPTPWFDTTPLFGPVSTGDWKIAAPVGVVRETVDPANLSVTNSTTYFHWLYPGDVTRSVVQDGTSIFIVTYGTGSGLFPRADEKLAPPVWNWTDGFAISRLELVNVPTPVWPNYSNGGNLYYLGRSSLPERRAGATGSTAASATSSISQSQRENRRIRVAGLNTWACDHAAS